MQESGRGPGRGAAEVWAKPGHVQGRMGLWTLLALEQPRRLLRVIHPTPRGPHACPDLIRRLLPSAAVPSRGLCSGGPSPDSPKTPALRDVCDRAVCRWPLSPLPALSLLCSFETPAATLCAHRPRAPPTPAHLRRDHRLQAPGRLPPWVALQPGTQRALSSEWMSNSYFQTEAYVLFPVPKAIGGGERVGVRRRRADPDGARAASWSSLGTSATPETPQRLSAFRDRGGVPAGGAGGQRRLPGGGGLGGSRVASLSGRKEPHTGVTSAATHGLAGRGGVLLGAPRRPLPC